MFLRIEWCIFTDGCSGAPVHCSPVTSQYHFHTPGWSGSSLLEIPAQTSVYQAFSDTLVAIHIWQIGSYFKNNILQSKFGHGLRSWGSDATERLSSRSARLSFLIIKLYK